VTAAAPTASKTKSHRPQQRRPKRKPAAAKTKPAMRERQQAAADLFLAQNGGNDETASTLPKSHSRGDSVATTMNSLGCSSREAIGLIEG